MENFLKMEKSLFQDIPQKYQALKNKIFNELNSKVKSSIFEKIYSNFKISYYKHDLINVNENDQDTNNGSQNHVENFLYDYLRSFHLITYQQTTNSKREVINCIICCENNLFIIEQIYSSIMTRIIDKLKDQQISLVKVSYSTFEEVIKGPQDEEIKQFCRKFDKEIKSNHFIEYTISPIICYLIRSFFYPSSFFTDPSFFFFNDEDKLNEFNFQQKLYNLLFTKEKVDLIEFRQMIGEINTKNSEEKPSKTIQYFKDDDFIFLRNKYTDNSIFSLVIHIESLHIFMVKKPDFQKDIEKQIAHEIHFNENYGNRCMTTFYGFLREENTNEIIGFVYEYMNNDTLYSFLNSKENQNKIGTFYSFLFIIRLFESIEYLQEQNLIHRDIKPSNIFIDHNFIPYLSDYDRIRHPLDKEEKKPDQYTQDIGSLWYSSPEQDQGNNILFPTDIYSFGLMIYFIYEKKHMWAQTNNSYNINKKDKPLLLTKSSLKIKNLYLNCINFDQEKRPKIDAIKNILIQEMNPFNNLDELFDENEQIKSQQFVHYIYEYLHIQPMNSIELFLFIKKILQLKLILNMKNENDESTFYFNLGEIYSDGLFKNRLKSIKYYNLAAKLKNQQALMRLATFYYNEKDYKKAKQYFEFAADLNNSEALCNLGSLYFEGYGVKRDYLIAQKYYEKSIKIDNNLNSLFNLALLYEKGYGVKQDYSIARKYYELAGDQNDSASLLKLGCFYEQGLGVDKDYKKANEYYEAAANLNNSDALFNLGNCYYEGFGVDKDFVKAGHYFELAAKQNHLIALYQLGVFYEKGLGVDQSYSTALKYYKLSSLGGNDDATLMLGNLYFHGLGCKKDYFLALELFLKSAMKSNANAFYNIGLMFKNGLAVRKDYLKANEYFETAASLNFSKAYVAIGDLYKHGLGFNQDYIKAKEKYKLAANLDDDDAYLSLGSLYYNGFGVVKDILRSKYYFELAAKKGNSDALFNLGLMYYNGIGVEKDLIKALKYLKESGDHGNEYAFLFLGTLYLNVYKNYLKAKKFFELSAMQNNSSALLCLGYLYFFGFGVSRDYSKAIEFFILSAKQNNSIALYILGCLYSSVDIDFAKAIYYYLKCIEIHRGVFPSYNSKDHSIIYSFKSNSFYYHSCNELGLIYILIFQDKEKATEYIKIAGLNGYSFGQNNYGVFNQFFLQDKKFAEYMYESASNQHFAIAEYNLGNLKEEENLIDDCINYYIQASNDEDAPFIFLGKKYCDKQLEISKMFIICLANLNLTLFYFTLKKYEDAKKYFIKSLAKINSCNHQYKFRFKFDSQQKDIFLSLRLFVLNFPLFNLKNQPNFNYDDLMNEDKITFKTNSLIEIYILRQLLNVNEIKNFETEKPDDFFDFVIKNDKLKGLFALEIKLIIIIMKKILYTPPYPILFGKISIENRKETIKSFIENINSTFYDGFGLEI